MKKLGLVVIVLVGLFFKVGIAVPYPSCLLCLVTLAHLLTDTS